MKKLFTLFLLALLCTACMKEVDLLGEPPTIIVDEVRLSVALGESVDIKPRYEHVGETTTYCWVLDGETMATTPSYTYRGVMAGEFYLSLTVTNDAGSAKQDFKITVYETETDPFDGAYIPAARTAFHWEFPATELNYAQGREVKVKAYFLENDHSGTYTWTLDGITVAEPATQQARAVEYILSGLTEGKHELILTMKNSKETQSQTFTVNVCPAEGTYQRPVTGSSRAMVNKVYEFMPAPGHQVNGYTVVGDFGPAGMTMQQACDSVYSHFQRKYMVSLGAQGGYLIAGFDHSVENSGDYDLCIKGNPYSYQSEPGIVWVSQDENGDGLPNDTWYELAGSEYGTDNEIVDYATTYYKPIEAGKPIYWKDNQGNTGIVPYMKMWNTHAMYWQDWVPGTEHTYFGSYLKNYVTYENAYSNEPPFQWGYADQLGEEYFEGPAGKCSYFKISNAVDFKGRKAQLKYIDFVKVQTAQAAWTRNLGEVSTEVYYISDYHLEK